jgi:UDP-2,4-diacetamido-2,4,6-trideoxy-beta-L-altropyranose hydrolase
VKVLLRADASLTTGTGHVMRVLTLGEALTASGHDVHLASSQTGIPWLEQAISDRAIPRHCVPAHTLSSDLLKEISPDWVVVDSYEIAPETINAIGSDAKVLAIIDGDSRGIEADLFLDHNVGAEDLAWPAEVEERILAGSRYTLIRRAIRDVRRAEPWVAQSHPPKILGFMGGTDPTGMIVNVARAVTRVIVDVQGVIISAPAWHDEVVDLVAHLPQVSAIPPTSALPELLATTDIAISAAGTSSWELCSLGIPSILIEVVDNQTESLREMTNRGLVIGLSPSDYIDGGLASAIATNLERLIMSNTLRRDLSEACSRTFDGLGTHRVVEAMTALSSSEKPAG